MGWGGCNNPLLINLSSLRDIVSNNPAQRVKSNRQRSASERLGISLGMGSLLRHITLEDDYN